MAERRMFAKTIVTSDAFLDMPPTARCLYFTLGMFADDDGFVNNPKSIMRQSGASVDDMNILIAKKFVITFESGVIVIKHWRTRRISGRHRFFLERFETIGPGRRTQPGRPFDGIPAVFTPDPQAILHLTSKWYLGNINGITFYC